MDEQANFPNRLLTHNPIVNAFRRVCSNSEVIRTSDFVCLLFRLWNLYAYKIIEHTIQFNISIAPPTQRTKAGGALQRQSNTIEINHRVL